MTAVGGSCDPRFAAVRDAFENNFAEHGEVGAAVCVLVDGVVVADLWGGLADPDRNLPWGPDALVDVFSVGKGLLAILAARLAGEGRLDVDAPVARYWPEFAAADKGDVTVRQLLSHQAGLPALRRPLPAGAMCDWALITAELAAEQPWWEPGTAHGYHTNTYGFLAGELLRRVSGRSVGELLREEVAGPLGADVSIGLPAPEEPRVAPYLWAMAAPVAAPDGLTGDALMEHNAYWNPPDFSGAGVVNTRRWRAAEIPSANAHGSARGVAAVYAAVLAGRLVAPDALAAATTEQVHGEDRILHRPSRFGLGFQLTQPERPLGPNPRAFGHFGAGGALGFCDPDAGVALGYVMNQMGPRWRNPRNRALIDAVYASL